MSHRKVSYRRFIYGKLDAISLDTILMEAIP